MGCSQSNPESEDSQRSRAIDAMLKQSKSQLRPVRALVVTGDRRNGWDELVGRMARAQGGRQVLASAGDAALALACVARFHFGCPKDVARLLFQWALRATETRALQVLRFPGAGAEEIELVRYSAGARVHKWLHVFQDVQVAILVIDVDFSSESWEEEFSPTSVVSGVMNSRWFRNTSVAVLVLHEERFEAAVAMAARFPTFTRETDMVAGKAFLLYQIHASNFWSDRKVEVAFVSEASDGRRELRRVWELWASDSLATNLETATFV
jgi:hypothetical protein